MSLAAIEIDAFIEELERLLDSKIYGTGAQAYVEVQNSVILDSAFGQSGCATMQVSDVHPVYCALKPLMAIGIAILEDSGELTYETKVSELMRTDLPFGCKSETTISELLCHGASLSFPSAARWRMTPPSDRDALRLVAQPITKSRYAYSEISGWIILGECIKSLTSMDADLFLRDSVLRPLGIDTEILVDPSGALDARERDRVRVSIGGLPVESIPMYSERLRPHLLECHSFFGGYSSMRGLGHFYSSVKAVMNGATISGLPSMGGVDRLIRCSRQKEWDHILKRHCSFAGGFMTQLYGHGFGPLVPQSAIGHSAGVANCSVITDARNDFTIAIYLNGVCTRSEDLSFVRERIYGSAIRRTR